MRTLLVAAILSLAFIISDSVQAESSCPSALQLIKRSQIEAFSDEEALKDLQQAIDQCPKLVEAHYELGRLQLRLGSFDKALSSFKKANSLQKRVEHSTGIALAHQLKGDYVLAENVYKESLVSHLGDWRLLEGLALLYFETGKLKSAEDLLRQALQEEPNESSIYLNLGRVLEARKQFEEALVSYSSAIDKNSLTDEPYVSAALLHLKTGEMDSAISILEDALRRFPASESSLLILANIQTLNLEIEDARKSLQKLDPDNQLAKLHLLALKLQDSDPSKEEALASIEKIYSSQQPNGQIIREASRTYGWALAFCEKHQEAIKVLQSAISLNETDFISMRNLGIVYAKLGNESEAERWFQEAKKNAIIPIDIPSSSTLSDG